VVEKVISTVEGAHGAKEKAGSCPRFAHLNLKFVELRLVKIE